MAKKKQKKSVDMKGMVNKAKVKLDPKTWKNEIRYKNETFRRLVEMYAIAAGVGIIGITSATVFFSMDETYPFNYAITGSVQDSITTATAKADDLEQKINDAKEYKDVVEAQKLRLDGLYNYLPSRLDPLSFMVYVEQLAVNNGITIQTLVLPEERQSAVVTNDIDITQQGNTPTNNLDPNSNQDNGSFLANITPEESNDENEGDNNSTPNVPTEVTYKDNAYVLDISVTGSYTKLTSFFKDLEKTREIIEISDVKIKEFEEVPLDDYGVPIPEDRREERVYDINNFDMNTMTTEITFKVKLYDVTNFPLTATTGTTVGNETGGNN